MSDYRSYEFIIGDSPKRIYKGLRLSPKPNGFEFGARVFKDIADLLCSSTDILDVANKPAERLCIEILSAIDIEKTISRYNFLLNNRESQITAIEEGGNKTYVLSDEDMYNEWFSKHPSDLLQVMVTSIWENASPFLPASWIGQMKEAKEAMIKAKG